MIKGMIKVSVFYPNVEGKTFDMNYYQNKHLHLVTESLGDSLNCFAVDEGLGRGISGSAAPFVAIANMYFNSMEEFGQASGESAEKLMADLPNFTNIENEIQISEVLL